MVMEMGSISEAAAGVGVRVLNLINCNNQELTDFREIHKIIIGWINVMGAYLSHTSKAWRQAARGLY